MDREMRKWSSEGREHVLRQEVAAKAAQLEAEKKFKELQERLIREAKAILATPWDVYFPLMPGGNWEEDRIDYEVLMEFGPAMAEYLPQADWEWSLDDHVLFEDVIESFTTCHAVLLKREVLIGMLGIDLVQSPQWKSAWDDSERAVRRLLKHARVLKDFVPRWKANRQQRKEQAEFDSRLRAAIEARAQK